MKLILRLLKLILLVLLLLFVLSPLLFSNSPENYITPKEYISLFEIEGGHFISIDDYETYYIERNSDSEETIILLHGFGGSATNWLPVIPALAEEGYRTIAFDLKGFGLSEKDVDDEYAHMDQVKFLHAFIQNFELEEVNLIGHSMGANVAVMYTQKHPENIKNLVIINGSIMEDKDVDMLRRRALRLLDLPVVRDYARITLHFVFDSDRINSILQSAMYMPENIEINEPLFINPTMFYGWEYIAIKMSASVDSNTLSYPLSKIEQPTLIVWGKEDTWIPVKRASSLHSEIQNSELMTIEDVGHLPMFESPKELSDVLIRYFNQQNSP